MVYDEVVDLAVADHLADVLEQAAAERLLDGVDQGDLLADYQVGVVRNADREGPEAFETGRRAVIDADIVDAGPDFSNSHIVNRFGFRGEFTKKNADRAHFPQRSGPSVGPETTFGDRHRLWLFGRSRRLLR